MVFWYSFFFYLLRLCGSRTAGELLFCLQQQKSNQKNAATTATPLQKTQGCPLKNSGYHAAPELAHVKRHVRSDMLGQKAHDNRYSSMAC